MEVVQQTRTYSTSKMLGMTWDYQPPTVHTNRMILVTILIWNKAYNVKFIFGGK